MDITDRDKTICNLENEVKEIGNTIPQQKLNLEAGRERNKHREHMGIALEEKKEQNRHIEKIKEFEQSIKELEILTNANLEKFKTNKNITSASNDTEIDTTTHTKCTETCIFKCVQNVRSKVINAVDSELIRPLNLET